MPARLRIATAAVLLSGCFFHGSDDDAGTRPLPDGNDRYEQDLAEYDALQAELDRHREEVLGERADEHRVLGRRLFWLDFTAFDPKLASLDTSNGARVDYAFSVGPGDAYNFEASDDLVATARADGDAVIFEAYAAAEPATLLGQLEVAAPTDEQRYWAYAVEGPDVYWVTTGERTTLHRWTPGSLPVDVVDLEDTGAEVGIFLAFAIEGDRMMFNESGRAWELDLAAGKSHFLGHETEVTGPVSFDDRGAFVPTAAGPLYYDFATRELTSVDDRIRASGFAINETYDSAHLYENDGVLEDGALTYVGQSGVFRLDLASGDVEPILLEPFDDEIRIEYRYPAVTSEGVTYVVGLTSTSGSVGADGPIYAAR